MSDKVVIKVEGMSCQHCVMRVQKALQAVPGVGEARVDLAQAKAEVSGAGLDVATLVQAVAKAGYKAAAA